MRRGLAVALSALALAIAGGCGEDGPAPGSEPGPDGELTVMTFNVWYGGGSVDQALIAEAITAADADIVGLQEPEGNTRRIANAAGMAYADPSLHLISRHPIYPVERDGIRFAYVEVEPGQVVAVANIHLPSSAYGPYEVRDGEDAEQVIASESRARLVAARPYGRVLGELAESGTPVFLTGDMNSPSHLDWTEEFAEAQELPYALDWPTSSMLADSGLRDSYREVHPDPVAAPGPTWTPGRPPPFQPRDETSDRIDWVLSGGPTRAVESVLVGEPGGPGVDVEVEPWGSDHRAVASSFEVDASPPPSLVAAEPAIVERGVPVAVRPTFADDVEGGVVAAILPAPAEGDEPLVTLPLRTGHDHVAPNLGTATLAPGAYRAALLDADGEALATTPMWVESPDARPGVGTTRTAYDPGETIGVEWSGAPGNQNDWIGIYRAGEPSVYAYDGFFYTGGRAQGRLAIGRDDIGELAPGAYEARLMLDDGYATLATSRFEIRPAAE